jgi:Tol biopolymer transport system component
MKRTAILIVALAALLPTAAHATFQGRNGAVAYGYSEGSVVLDDQSGDEVNYDEESIRVYEGRYDESRFIAGCHEIYRSDGTCARQSAGDPAFSPDGARLVFDAGASLALADFDAGASFHLLPAHGQNDGKPAFSPDGSQLVFSSGAPIRYGHRSHRSVWISNIDGGGARRLGEGDAPAWSSRGWIAFVRQRAVYRVRPDGTGKKLLARNSTAPEWSPDGRRLAVSYLGVRNRRTRRMIRRRGVILMDADGRHAHLLEGKEATESPTDIAWSPDGRRLLILTESLSATQNLETIDLRGKRVHDYGEVSYDGADSVSQTNGIAWQPRP